MFKFFKNLIPVSRKIYEKEKKEYLKDIERIEFLEGLIKEDEETIEILDGLLTDKNIEINRLELKVETLSNFLEKERERNSDLFKILVDLINNQEENQVKAVG